MTHYKAGSIKTHGADFSEERALQGDEENELWMDRCRLRLVLTGESGKVVLVFGLGILKIFGRQMGAQLRNFAFCLYFSHSRPGGNL